LIWSNGTASYFTNVVDAVSNKPYSGCERCHRMMYTEGNVCPHCGQEQSDGSKTVQEKFAKGSNV
jgi:predicted amidophosphoribosyltransferase